jgi:hypothetical protein
VTRIRLGLFALLALIWAAAPALAQHVHHHPPGAMPRDSIALAAPSRAPHHHAGHAVDARLAFHPGHDESAGMPEHEMAFDPLGISHSRHGSGTSWVPDATPLHHVMGHAGAWTLMGHGSAFFGYVKMNGPRGDERFTAPNMLMVMGEKNSDARTLWRLSGMFSTDIATVGGEGYPLLFQTGETWKREPLHDHQHPHNILSEISVALVHAFTPSVALDMYAAPVGEPALGPPAFPHRPVGLHAPLSPIGHHWQDATHIAYGVVTAVLQTTHFQIEGSAFNGREPGEDRLAIDRPEFDSASGRLSVNPIPSVALQISHGYLHEPEDAHPGIDAWRTTASAMLVRRLGMRSADGTVIWGRNHSGDLDLDSWLVEAECADERRWTPFARFEWVEKTAEELVIADPAFDPHQIFALRQATLGVVFALPFGGSYFWGVDAQGLWSLAPDALDRVYGEHPGGWAAFVTVHPRAMEH